MNRAFLPFALPDCGNEEISAVTEVLRSGWITTGPKAKQFENAFSEFLGGDRHAIVVNSATAGLHLALEALGIGVGDEVITSTLTFTATAEVVRYLGAEIVLVDVDPVTLNLDVNRVQAAITARTKAIIPVHYGGLACAMDEILTIARERGIKVVEDAAHALPASSGGQLIGRLDSDATVFSFYANKTMTTGEGGMIVTPHAELARRMRIMRLHGIDRDAFARFNSKVPAWYYEVVAPGFKYNLTDISAAIGIEQLRKLSGFHARRQFLARRYLDRLQGLPLILPATARRGDEHAWHLFVIRLRPGLSLGRDEAIQGLSNLGIGTSVHYVPLHRQPYWRDRYGLATTMFPHADAAYQTMISIPLYTAMSDADQDRVIVALHDVFSGA